jgi:hypothetical protein
MTRLSSVVAGAGLLVVISTISTISASTWQPAPAPGQARPASAGDGWISLFDGKSLNGWRAYRKPDAAESRWTVQDGLLTLPARTAGDTRPGRDLITTDTFDLFELSWEWKVAPGGNSGVKYYVLEDQNSAIGHEYQVLDDERHADAKIGPHRQTASLYDVLAAPGPRPTRPAGEWNSSVVRVTAGRAGGHPRVVHLLNDVQVLEYELDSPALRQAIAKSKFKDVARFGKLHKGHILLQDHNDQVWYRSIRIRRLPAQS